MSFRSRRDTEGFKYRYDNAGDRWAGRIRKIPTFLINIHKIDNQRMPRLMSPGSTASRSYSTN